MGHGSEGPGAAIAGRAVMVTVERVATTRATTTSRVVANLCLMRSTFLQCAGPLTATNPTPRGLGSILDLVRLGRGRVTGFKGPAALPWSRFENRRPPRGPGEDADAGVDHRSSRIGKSPRRGANCTSRLHAAIRASWTALHLAELWR